VLDNTTICRKQGHYLVTALKLLRKVSAFAKDKAMSQGQYLTSVLKSNALYMQSKRILHASPLKNVCAIAFVVFLLLLPLAFGSRINIRNTGLASSAHISLSTVSSSSNPGNSIGNSSRNVSNYSEKVIYSNTITTTTTNSNNSAPSTSIIIDGESQQPIDGFNSSDTNMIKRVANQSIQFLLSLESPNGMIPQTAGSNQVYTRDLSLAIIALTLANRTQDAFRGFRFLLGLKQGASYYTTAPVNTITSPDAWYQIYYPSGVVEEKSLRGEDQGMVLLALATYYKATGNISLISSNWSKIQNAANFIVSPEHARSWNAFSWSISTR
jgi:hypothetical protein